MSLVPIGVAALGLGLMRAKRSLTSTLSGPSNSTQGVIDREILTFKRELGIDPITNWNTALRTAFASKLARMLGISSQAFVGAFLQADPPIETLADAAVFLKQQI
jgi:hypothetical protein